MSELGQLKILQFIVARQSVRGYNKKIAAWGVSSGQSHNLCKGKIMPETIPTKICSKCKHILPVSIFCKDRSKSDGLYSSCKTCMNTTQRRYFRSSRGKQVKKAYGQIHAEQKSRYQKQYYQGYKKTERYKDTRYRYEQSEKGRMTKRRNNHKCCLRHPDRMKARHVIGNAIAAGQLCAARKLKCHYCNERANQYHHYLGYAPEQWFDVIPLCRSCHKTIHYSLKKAI
jgi:hypothetical protein